MADSTLRFSIRALLCRGELASLPTETLKQISRACIEEVDRRFRDEKVSGLREALGDRLAGLLRDPLKDDSDYIMTLKLKRGKRHAVCGARIQENGKVWISILCPTMGWAFTPGQAQARLQEGLILRSLSENPYCASRYSPVPDACGRCFQ